MKVQVSRKALREIARSDEVELALFAIADEIKEAIDPTGEIGYVANSGKGRNRARASVVTTTRRAIRHNAKHQALVKGLGGAHG